MTSEEAKKEILNRFKWKAVEAPRPWNPREPGLELVGFYGGKTLRNGTFGQYEVVIVHVPIRGAFLVSGTRIIQLVDVADLEKGVPLRIVFAGRAAVGRDMERKEFELYVAEGFEKIQPEFLPQLPEVVVQQ